MKSLVSAVVPTAVIEPELVTSNNRMADLLPELPSYAETVLLNLNDDKGFCHRNLTKEEKATFCRFYAMTGSMEKSADHINISLPTAYRHLRSDPDFQDAFSLAKLSMLDRIQAKSVEMAGKDHGVTDRMCQLKRMAPQVYGSHIKENISNNFFIAIPFAPKPSPA